MRKITFIILALFLVSLVSAQTFRNVNLTKKSAAPKLMKRGEHKKVTPTIAKNITANLSESFNVFPPAGWSVDPATGYWIGSATTTNIDPSAYGDGLFAFADIPNYDAGDVGSMITPVLHPVAGNNTLSYDIMEIYYGTPSWIAGGMELYIEFSTDGTTWTTSTTNVLTGITGHNTAGVATTPSTFTVDLSAYNGGSVQVRFRAVSDWGGFALYIDNVTGPEADVVLATNDVMVSKVYADFSGMSYYAITPISQIGPINFGAAITNLGSAAQTNISLEADLNNGTFTANVGNNNPIVSLAASASDTLWAELTGLTAALPTEFGVSITATQDQTDENADDNSDSVYFSVDTTQYFRAGSITSVLSSYSFAGSGVAGATGFEFGTNYHFLNQGTVNGISVVLYGATGTGTVVGHLYNVDLTTGARTEVATTAAYTPTTTYGIMEPITIPLTTNYEITNTSVLTATVELVITAPADTIFLLGDNTYPGDFEQSAVYLQYQGSWQWLVLTSTMPLVGLTVVNSTGVNEVNTSDVVAYPNPTTGILNIANAENANVSVFNMLGQQVINVSNVKSIDMSSLPAGSYFVKIQTNDNIVTKRINLVK